MSRRVWIGVLVAIAAVAVGWMLLQPMNRQDEGAYPPPDADFGSTVTVSNARLVLPGTAGNPAMLLLDIANRGDRNLYLSEIVVEHGGRAELTDFSHPAPKLLDSIEIPPGETVRFEGGSERTILTDYNANVVPGAEVTVELTFGNGESLSLPATVEASLPEAGGTDGAAGDS
ncbi:copper chaperone PCu(A)C [Pelagerythrobacter rhizovicinus]|uniref:Copper chaperone PCu(A)C n=1 Tax=Pelagerythrobacter rhizovicinus TaxID=2268576 RepID=A0A4Q2KLX3_9SPHN|nr:copper chaperone PCu(A)C [Pelagerythrobacter rhizovicinus]RXZ65417.1 copper chaperone PCu(A)C [Pelagerythrobacter rhizovicinus]